MQVKTLLAIATFAAIATGAARAEGDNLSHSVQKFEGTRTRAEVQAEAARVPATRSNHPEASRVAQQPKSNLDAASVRAEAVQALRSGQINYGEAGVF